MIRDLHGFISVPTPFGYPRTAASASTQTLDAEGEKAGIVIRAPKTGSISRFGFLVTEISGAPIIDARLETVGTDGNPTGDLLGSDSHASQILSTSGWKEGNLNSVVSVTKGDLLAYILSYSGTGSVTIRSTYIPSIASLAFPYVIGFTTSWTKSSAACSCFYLGYAGSTSAPMGLCPASSVSNRTFHVNSEPDELGNKFQLPFPARLGGIWYVAQHSSSTTNDSVLLYDSDGTTVLYDATYDNDLESGAILHVRYLLFNRSIQLKKDTAYRIAFRPNTTAVFTLVELTVNNVTNMDAFDLSTNMTSTSRTDGGAWTDTNTFRCCLGLLLDGFDDGAFS